MKGFKKDMWAFSLDGAPVFKGGDVSHCLKYFRGVYIGRLYGSVIGVIKGDTRSVDYGSYVGCSLCDIGIFIGFVGST